MRYQNQNCVAMVQAAGEGESIRLKGFERQVLWIGNAKLGFRPGSTVGLPESSIVLYYGNSDLPQSFSR